MTPSPAAPTPDPARSGAPGPGRPALPAPAHALEPAALLRALGSDEIRGLGQGEAAARRARYGPNEISSGQAVPPWVMLFRQFQDLMVAILVLACLISLASWALEGAHGLPADALVIGAIVVLNAGLGFVQEYRAEKTVEELKKMASTGTRVIRDGEALSLDRAEVVPGDLVLLDEGDRVPADLVLLKAERLRIDESLLTGESVSVGKRVGAVPEAAPVDSRTCALHAGTVVTGGHARAVVVATGAATQLGGIAENLATTETVQTPLQQRLDRLGRQIGWVVLALSVLISLALLAVEQRFDAPTLVRILMFAVALAVAAVPEGLPAVLTISLSIGARRLARRQAVVRRMPAVETLGSVTTIVTDKTGTLTHNQMTASRLFVDGLQSEVGGRGYELDGALGARPSQALDLLLKAGALASTADLQEEAGGEVKALGDPTEAALLVLASKAGLDWRELRRAAPELSAAPFSSERARMSSLRELEGTPALFVKGSLEQLLARSDRHLSAGRVEPLDPDTRRRYLAEEERMAAEGLRSLALAWRPLTASSDLREAEALEGELILLGLVAMGDPPRREVPEAIARCHRAGIRVVMLTGDHPHTARTLAQEIGLSSTDEVLTGPQIASWSDSDLDRALDTCRVFARVSPEAKLRLVDRLLARGEVVAMTGDGVNDAPALKKVHVGVAMGSGTAVAVEASEMVLLDDNFATIVTAIEGGRGVFANLQKFIAFLFSGNFGVVLAMFLGTLMAGIFGLDHEGGLLLPLTAAQILWMNLVTDGAPAVAFSLSRSRREVLEDPPRDPEDPILSSSLWSYILATGTWVAMGLLLVLDLGYAGGLLTLPQAASSSAAMARTAAFYMVVTTRLCNALNFQALPGSLLNPLVWRDPYVPLACLGSWLLTLTVLYVPALRGLFQLEPLPLLTLATLTLAAPSILLFGELWRAWMGVSTSVSGAAPRRPSPPR